MIATRIYVRFLRVFYRHVCSWFKLSWQCLRFSYFFVERFFAIPSLIFIRMIHLSRHVVSFFYSCALRISNLCLFLKLRFTVISWCHVPNLPWCIPVFFYNAFLLCFKLVYMIMYRCFFSLRFFSCLHILCISQSAFVSPSTFHCCFLPSFVLGFHKTCHLSHYVYGLFCRFISLKLFVVFLCFEQSTGIFGSVRIVKPYLAVLFSLRS